MVTASDVRRRGGIIQSIVRPFLTSYLSIILLVAALLAGAVSIMSTPREEEPQIIVPMADVYVNFPGASAREVEQLVARPLEKILWQIDGVEYVYSISRRGQAVVTVRFFVGEDRERSLVKLRNRVAMHQDLVVPGVTGWLIKPVEIDDVPIVSVALYSSELDGHALHRVAEEVVASLDDLDDLSRTELVGGHKRKILVLPDQRKLAGYNLSLLEIVGALRAADSAVDAGSYNQDGRVIEVAAGPFIASVKDLRRIVVGVHQGRPVFLSDVAEVNDGPGEHGEFVFFGVIDRVDEYLAPLVLVELAEIRPVVVAGPARLFAVQLVARVGLGDLHPVDVFPAAHQLVEVARSQLVQVLLEQLEQIQGDVEGDGAARVLGAPAGHVLVHDLVETEDGVLGGDIVGVDLFHRQVVLLAGPGDCPVPGLDAEHLPPPVAEVAQQKAPAGAHVEDAPGPAEQAAQPALFRGEADPVPVVELALGLLQVVRLGLLEELPGVEAGQFLAGRPRIHVGEPAAPAVDHAEPFRLMERRPVVPFVHARLAPRPSGRGPHYLRSRRP